jgi:hypothetical protein
MFLGTTKRSPRIVLSYDLASQTLIDSTTAQDFDYRVVQTVGNKERRGSSPFRRLSPTDISRDVRPESCHTSARWSVNGYVALITDEASRSRVKDHYTQKPQVAVSIILKSVSKKTGRRLRVNQFWPKILNLARKNVRSLDGQKLGFWSEASRMFCPVCPCSALSQVNCIWIRKTSVDGEISIIDSLGVECRKYRERESKKKRISSDHKDASLSSSQLDVMFHCSAARVNLSVADQGF